MCGYTPLTTSAWPRWSVCNLGKGAHVVEKAGVSIDDLDEIASLPELEVVGTNGQLRADPPPRPTDAVSAQGALLNKQADRHYVWVNKTGDPTFNIGTYLAKGYKVERFDKNNPNQARPVIGWQEYEHGAPIEAVACVLMSCSLEHKQMIDAQAQADVDRTQKIIREGRVDPLSAEDRADFRHIRFERHGDDNRRSWGF